jgi:putative addiction module killer protein
MGYTTAEVIVLIQLRRTDVFNDWLANLRDRAARVKITTRLDRLEEGNPGNSRSVGGGIVEMKIDFGPGYRVYYVQKGQTLILLLCGGDKSTQDKDIEGAKALAARYEKE